MQPVRVGVSAVLVLLILLLSVPLQLLLSNLVASSLTEEETGRDLTHARGEAVEQLVDSAEAVFNSLHSTVMYYSTWNHFKELVLVPYQKPVHTSLQSTVFKSKAGTTTILISSMDATKTTTKTKASESSTSQSKTSSTTSETGKTGKKTSSTGSGTAATGGTGGQANTRSRFQKTASETESNEKTTSSSSAKTTAKRKPVIIEEVSHAKEVEDYLMQEVYFAQSKAPRDHRPLSVRFSVGQLMEHKTAKYVGVIIGWDTVAKAPEKWIKQYYSDRKGVELTTHYLILVDSKYSASGTPYHYIPQEDIQLGPQQPLRCPEASEYFEGFQNGRHIPKPWLQNRYPRD